jgi:hypothetical protein
MISAVKTPFDFLLLRIQKPKDLKTQGFSKAPLSYGYDCVIHPQLFK